MALETAKMIASFFALAAFAVAIVAGLPHASTPAQNLLRATLAAAFCYPVGLVVGYLCARTIKAHVERDDARNVPNAEPSSSSQARARSDAGATPAA
jgi:hypothetical protein